MVWVGVSDISGVDVYDESGFSLESKATHVRANFLKQNRSETDKFSKLQ